MIPTERHNNLKLVDTIPIFSCLRSVDKNRVNQIITRKQFRKNSVILMEDDSKNFMYIIISGRIKVVRTSADGKEQILVIRNKGDFFGELTLLDGKSQPATIVALEDATVGLISKTDFEQYFMRDAKILKQIVSMLCERLRESWVMLKVLGLTTAEARVRAVLAHMSSIYGIKDVRGVLIPLKLTHKELAEFTALARETVSRLLTRLCQSGEIEIIGRKNILIKPSFGSPR